MGCPGPGGGCGALNPGDDAKKVDGDLKKMQGTRQRRGGAELKWVFDGDVLKSTVNGTEYTSKLEVEAKGEPHPTIDFTITDGPKDAMEKAKDLQARRRQALRLRRHTVRTHVLPIKAVEDQPPLRPRCDSRNDSNGRDCPNFA